MTRRPPDAVLAAIALAILALPVAHLAGAPGVGSFSMFSAPREYRLRIAIRDAAGASAPVPLRALSAHLSRDARRVLVPASRWRMGETSLELLPGALPDVADLVCRLRPTAREVEIVLETRGRAAESSDARDFPCARN